MLAQQLDSLLSAAIAAGGSEPEIIRKFTIAAAAIPPTATVKVKAGFIHQRPYAFFVQPSSIAGREKCELGDILYVYKELDRSGTLVNARVAFVQAKKGVDHWAIEPHQLEFLVNIKRIQFRFGNSVYKRGGYTPIIYNGLPHSGELAQYLLMGPSSALSYSVKRVAARQKLYLHGFALHDNNAISCKEANVDFCANHDSHKQFLERFCQGDDGAKLAGRLRDIVELIYKRIGWVLDPPEEFADNFIEDGRGFAVVEVTSTSDKPLQQREDG